MLYCICIRCPPARIAEHGAKRESLRSPLYDSGLPGPVIRSSVKGEVRKNKGIVLFIDNISPRPGAVSPKFGYRSYSESELSGGGKPFPVLDPNPMSYQGKESPLYWIRLGLSPMSIRYPYR